MINLRTCPFDMCLIVNLRMFYPIDILVGLESSAPRTNLALLTKRQFCATLQTCTNQILKYFRTNSLGIMCETSFYGYLGRNLISDAVLLHVAM